MRRSLLLVLAILALVVPAWLGLSLIRSRQGPCAVALPLPKTGKISYTSTARPFECVALEVADTPTARQAGLAGRQNLAPNRGMLFVFDRSQTTCLWMKDMRFNIDMLWLSEDGKILQIINNVSPDTYPENFCAGATKYVIELAGGTAQRAGLQVGQQLNL